MKQEHLFGPGPVVGSIEGLVYEADFLSEEEERGLMAVIQKLPLRAAQYKQYVARRRVMSFGGSYDFDTQQLRPAGPLDQRLHALRDRAARWLGMPAAALVHALVAEYAPGTPLGWHRDVPDFETVVGVSLGGHATLRFRPYAPAPGAVPGRHPSHSLRRIVQLHVAPRSIYMIAGDARWGWQHSVAPTRELRWSVTFRTARAR